MRVDSSAIGEKPRSLSESGIALGLIGVIAFSFTVPFTAIAVDALDPMLVACGRAVVAGTLACLALIATGTKPPTRRQWLGLVPVALGVVAGFPILTSLALQHTTSGHAAVIIGVLPAATAVAAVIMVGERPSRRFWIGVCGGVLATVGFSVAAHGTGVGGFGPADPMLFGAVALGAVGYAQGGRMARELGAWQTVSWALVLALPAMTAISAWSMVENPPSASVAQWSAFGYLAVVSMFLGFFAWYRGLAIGPMATVAQTQLTQPLFTLAWGALLLGERPGPVVYLGAAAVITAAAFTVRSRIG